MSFYKAFINFYLKYFKINLKTQKNRAFSQNKLLYKHQLASSDK